MLSEMKCVIVVVPPTGAPPSWRCHGRCGLQGSLTTQLCFETRARLRDGSNPSKYVLLYQLWLKMVQYYVMVNVSVYTVYIMCIVCTYC